MSKEYFPHEIIRDGVTYQVYLESNTFLPLCISIRSIKKGFLGFKKVEQLYVHVFVNAHLKNIDYFAGPCKSDGDYEVWLSDIVNNITPSQLQTVYENYLDEYLEQKANVQKSKVKLEQWIDNWKKSA